MLPVPDFIIKAFESSSLNIVFRGKNNDKWKQVLDNCTYVPFAYLENNIAFQLAIMSGSAVTGVDISVIILHDKKPCAIWPLYWKEEAGKVSITGFGTTVLPPLFVGDIAPVSKKNITKDCIYVLQAIGKHTEHKTISAEEVFLDTANISDWHYECIRKGAAISVRYDLYVNLGFTIEKIKNCFRKSYRSLISSGLKTWQVGKLENADPSVWEEFRQLHIKVAGRETRIKKSWDIHYDAVVAGFAFLIYLRNDMGEMIGGGLFIHSKQECFYGVAAYDRSLFDKPLGHVVQFVAIEEMKKRGLQWYKAGTRIFPTDIPKPSEKEISVTEFKEGFATDIFPKYLLSIPV